MESLASRRQHAAWRLHKATLQGLESRTLLSTSEALINPDPHGPVCTCPLCQGANTQSTALSYNTTIKKLDSAAGLKSAQLFNSLSAIPARDGVVKQINATSFSAFTLNWNDLVATLDSAPNEFSAEAKSNPLVLELPRPDGNLERFEIVESSIMEPGLAAQFPDIKTFRGMSLDDPTASIRLDHTPLGFHAQVLSANGAYYIDPYYLNDTQGAYGSYFKRDAINLKAADWSCTVLNPLGVPELAEAPAAADPLGALPFGTTMKTYRLAVATTGEYTAAVGGGTVSGGQAAVVTAVNRVVGVYNTELSVSMTLVANNSSLIYTNSSTDPYTNSNGSTMLTQNQSTVDSIIGSGNYDIGHVFSTGGGGVAYLGVVGTAGSKAGGVTGNTSPTGDSFWIDYVAHEMGHQFGGNHTFNGTLANLAAPNRNASTAYEPGSGTTIMAYAGIGGNDDLAAHSDPYFAWKSIDEIRNLVDSRTTIGTSSATGNSAPSVSAGASYTIPAQTPFILTANSGSDPNGDPITYDWQEADLGAAKTLSAVDNGASPLMRVYNPTSSPSRMVPTLASVLAGSQVTNTPKGFPGERLPTVAHSSFKWRVLVRDNRSSGGGVGWADVTHVVVNTGSAFAVTAPNTATSVTGGSSLAVTWNVAGTTANGINTANVKISLSTDGGNTFPTVLSSSTANDGSENLTLPNISTTTARIKVEAVGNIFFDIGNANFTITAVTNSAVPGTPTLVAASDTGAFNNDRVTKLDNSIVANVLQFSVPGTVSAATVRVYSDGNLIGTATASGTTTTVTTNGSFDLTDGTHNITASQTEVSKTASTQSAATQITVDTIAPTIVSSGFDFEVAQKISFKFSESVNTPSLSGSNFTVTGIGSGDLNVGYNGSNNAAALTYALNNGIFPDGNYNASVASAADLAGNAVSGSGAFAFSFLQADATDDELVDTEDFNILAANFGLSGGFSQGNFDYTGTVDSTDFDIFVAQYGKHLAPAAPLRPTGIASPSLFSGSPVSSGEKEVGLLA